MKSHKIDCISDYELIKKNTESNLNIYAKSLLNAKLDKFKITNYKKGNYPAIITISGFTSEDKDNKADWYESVMKSFPDREWFHLEWNAENINLENIVNSSSLKDVIKVSNFPKALGLIALPLLATNVLTSAVTPLILDFPNKVINNYWSSAVRNTNHAGICLANILHACDKKEFVLIGHSLGARIIYNCLKYSIENNMNSNVVEIHLLGGAICGNIKTWNLISKALKNEIHNYFSDNDQVLNYLFRIGMFTLDKPIGLKNIYSENVKNKNVTSRISGHTAYIENFHHIKNF